MEKYSNIIIQREDCEIFASNLSILAEVISDERVTNILRAVGLNNDAKIDFLLSFCKNNNSSFINFVKILSQNKSLEKIPLIYKNLENKLALKNNIYSAIVFSNKKLSVEEIEDFEIKLTKYFKKTIKIKNQHTDKNEIKVYIEDLGYEILVSEVNLKNKLKDFIIKAI